MSTILYAMSKIIGVKLKIVRIITIAFLSSMISIAILVLLPTMYDNLFIKFLISILIVEYGFRLEDTVTIMQRTILFWTIIFLMGGLNIFAERNVIEMIIIFGTIVISIISSRKRIKKKIFLESATCYLEFVYEGKNYKLKTLVDTGHDVKSVYGEDVIFVRKNLLDEGGDVPKRLVSYKTISGIEKKMGIKVKNINITYGTKKIYSNAVIVTTPNISQGFDAIIGYDLVEGGMLDGNINVDETKSKKTIY
ncbi:MAG: sigma-E processing peptidase SpoIIGA [Clostridia bacterium]|nr:sigma-E processing peptidase SpoIIGA [Clostridia bacterium]